MTDDNPEAEIRSLAWVESLAALATLPTSAWEMTYNLMQASMTTAWGAQQATLTAAARSLELIRGAYARMWGLPVEQAPVEDSRFKAEIWRSNPAYDLIHQAYLITSRWMLEVAEGWQELDPDLHKRLMFYTQQLVDALSPSNYPLTNPEVLEETLRTGGWNLVRGARHLVEDLHKGRISQVPEDAFRVGVDLAVTPGKVVFRNQLIELIQYTPTTDQVWSQPLLFIPPWINKYYVLDMRPANSLIKYLVDSGFTVFTISWKNPGGSMRDLTWEDYIFLAPLAATQVIAAITGSEQLNAVGYCLGGVLLETTLAYLSAIGDQTIQSATYFATHQDFSQAGDIAMFISDPEVRFLEWLMELSGGYLDGRNMAATFNTMRANDLLWSYVINNYMMGKEPPVLDLLYWNSDGTRVPKSMHSFLLRNFFLVNNFAKPDHIQIKGIGLDTRRITTPTYCVATIQDHIVPWKGAFAIHKLINAPVRFVLGESGHVAGIINPPAGSRRGYWTNETLVNEPIVVESDTSPDAWLSSATKHQGSWWPDWVDWLSHRSGEKVDPPEPGSPAYPPLMDAPGTYVLEK